MTLYSLECADVSLRIYSLSLLPHHRISIAALALQNLINFFAAACESLNMAVVWVICCLIVISVYLSSDVASRHLRSASTQSQLV